MLYWGILYQKGGVWDKGCVGVKRRNGTDGGVRLQRVRWLDVGAGES